MLCVFSFCGSNRPIKSAQRLIPKIFATHPDFAEYIFVGDLVFKLGNEAGLPRAPEDLPCQNAGGQSDANTNADWPTKSGNN
jgi:hypothetical protein